MSSGKIIVNGHFRPQRVTGVQRYAWEILSQFDERNVAYDWIGPPGKLRADSLRHLWIQGVMPFKIPAGKILWSPTNIGPVFCENQVLTLHDIADQTHPEWFEGRYAQWRSIVLPKLLKRVRRVITVSRFSKESIISHYPEAAGKVRVIHNGVQTEHFYPRANGEINELKQELDLQKPFILSVGSLEERKNIRRLVKAWKFLPDTIKDDFDLVITGESARKFSFMLDEQPDDSIRFTGYIKDEYLPVLYSGATIFVYPSLFEGFGLPVLEAMACRTPVITSNTTALKEVAGDAALLVNPESIDEIRSAIVTLITDETQRSDMTSKGLKHANNHTWSKSADQTYDCLMGAV